MAIPSLPESTCHFASVKAGAVAKENFTGHVQSKNSTYLTSHEAIIPPSNIELGYKIIFNSIVGGQKSRLLLVVTTYYWSAEG